MKRFLKKRWHRIPVGIVMVIIALVLVAGSALAAFNVYMGNANVTVVEAITISNTGSDNGEEFTDGPNNAAWNVSLYPGESKFLNVLVTNASPAGLTITTTGTGNEGITAAWTGDSSVPGNSNIILTLTVTADGDAYPGGRVIFFMIERS